MTSRQTFPSEWRSRACRAACVGAPPQLPLLPLRDTVLFPNSFMPLAVARESSIRLIDQAVSEGSPVGVFTQRDAAVEAPTSGRPVP